jgi:hypothetical protein
MPNIDRKKLQEQMLKDGCTVTILNKDGSIKSREHIPPPTKEELAELEAFKASEKLKYMSNTITCNIPKNIDLKRIKVVDDFGNEYPFTHTVTVP